MNCFPVPPQLKGPKGHILAARIEVPILAAMIYGVVEFIRLGWSQDHYFYTYAPVLGRRGRLGGSFHLFFCRIGGAKDESRKISCFSSGFFPILYALYIMGVLGLYTILEGVIGEDFVWSMISGVFWVFVGFHLIYRFYLVTEIVRRCDEKAMLAQPATDIS